MNKEILKELIELAYTDCESKDQFKERVLKLIDVSHSDAPVNLPPGKQGDIIVIQPQPTYQPSIPYPTYPNPYWYITAYNAE